MIPYHEAVLRRHLAPTHLQIQTERQQQYITHDQLNVIAGGISGVAKAAALDVDAPEPGDDDGHEENDKAGIEHQQSAFPKQPADDGKATEDFQPR